MPNTLPDRPSPVTGEERVLTALADMIASQDLKPGDVIRQEDLAARAAVSRLPVRQALSRLAAEGAVRLVPNYGAYLIDLSAEELRQVHRVREVLENAALEEAATSWDADSLNRVEQLMLLVEDAMEARLSREVTSRNLDFHYAIFDLSSNPFLIETIQQYWRRVAAYQTQYLSSEARWKKLALQHRAIFKALKARDASTLIEVNATHRNQFASELIPWLAQL